LYNYIQHKPFVLGHLVKIFLMFWNALAYWRPIVIDAKMTLGRGPPFGLVLALPAKIDKEGLSDWQ
jgi:hypothetical protein